MESPKDAKVAATESPEDAKEEAAMEEEREVRWEERKEREEEEREEEETALHREDRPVTVPNHYGTRHVSFCGRSKCLPAGAPHQT